MFPGSHMHFWIDKRSQGCGFNGYGRNHRFLCAGRLHHPKSMVTPVHRFQSIESVANNGLRHHHHIRTTGQSYHTRLPTHCIPSVHYNGASSSIRHHHHSQQMGRSLEMITTGQLHTPTPRRNSNTTTKLKCGVWVFFAVVTFFLAGAKYYFHGINIGMEAFAFCSLLIIILIVGGLVSLCEAITATANATGQSEESGRGAAGSMGIENQSSLEEDGNQGPIAAASTAELPPPPYHIAIMLPSNHSAMTEGATTTTQAQIIHDSPPPSYEKAVT